MLITKLPIAHQSSIAFFLYTLYLRILKKNGNIYVTIEFQTSFGYSKAQNQHECLPYF